MFSIILLSLTVSVCYLAVRNETARYLSGLNLEGGE